MVDLPVVEKKRKKKKEIHFGKTDFLSSDTYPEKTGLSSLAQVRG